MSIKSMFTINSIINLTKFKAMGTGDDKMYFPCARLLKESITDKDMSLGERLFMGTISLVGTLVYDPVDAIFTAFDLDRGEHQDPDDVARM